ncbi:hypothetical protein KTH_11570 [Thermosporothrix hazakensis]|nr:hypothetical protein KTH_11570 [Thermosporothrix hazakensis]
MRAATAGGVRTKEEWARFGKVPFAIEKHPFQKNGPTLQAQSRA